MYIRIMYQCFLLLCALVFLGCKEHVPHKQECEIRAFGTNPALNVLLELIAPESMVGLSYKPYPEDVEFMPKGVADLPVLGHLGDNSLSFENLVSLKPHIIFFDKNVADSVIEPYERLGIKAIKLPSFEDTYSEELIYAYMKALQSDELCGEKIKQRAQKLLSFVKNTRELLERLRSSKNEGDKALVYFAQGFDGLKTECAREDNDLAALMGARNVFTCTQRQAQIDIERLIVANPEVIFVREISVYQNLMKSPSPLWEKIDALKNKRVYYAPSTPSNWLMRPPSVMRTLGLLWGFSKIYPKDLSDDEVKSIAQDFFATFLQPLSDETYQRLQGLDKSI